MINGQANTVAKSDSGTPDTVALSIALAFASDHHEPTVRGAWTELLHRLRAIGIGRDVSGVQHNQTVKHGQIG